MTPATMIGTCLAGVSAITNIVSTRVFFGKRPQTTVMPCINYFEMAGGKRQNGFERVPYSINCRATTAETAIQLARSVVDLFQGTSGTGIYGYQTNFEISRASVSQAQGLIPEPTDDAYNAPVDIMVVYPTSSVS